MANQKRFETVKFTVEQARIVIDLINEQIQLIRDETVSEGNASKFVKLQGLLVTMAERK